MSVIKLKVDMPDKDPGTHFSPFIGPLIPVKEPYF